MIFPTYRVQKNSFTAIFELTKWSVKEGRSFENVQSLHNLHINWQEKRWKKNLDLQGSAFLQDPGLSDHTWPPSISMTCTAKFTTTGAIACNSSSIAPFQRRCPSACLSLSSWALPLGCERPTNETHRAMLTRRPAIRHLWHLRHPWHLSFRIS